MTGLGVVSALGVGAKVTMERLLAGERAQRPVTLFDTAGCRSSIAAELASLSVADVAPRGDRAAWSRTDAMALLAAREALAQAQLEPARYAVALAVGGTTAGMFETEALLAAMHADPAAREVAAQMLTHPLSATTDRLCSALGPFRTARTVSSACSSGKTALLVAMAWLRIGRARRVLVGGADGLCRLTYTGFSCLGALAKDACRPFDRARDGLNLGEGAAFFVLETESSARERGAVPLAELRGVAVGSEGHHITNPEASGATAARIMTAALARAELSPADVGYVNAHGTATPHNDAMEARALGLAFGEHLSALPVSSSKGQLGHTLGAAGALEAAIAVMAMLREELPPTMGLEDVDPACALEHVRARRSARIDAVLSSSFGFGGSDAAAVFARPEAFERRARSLPRRVVVAGVGTLGALGVAGRAGAASYLAREGSDASRGDAPPGLEPAQGRAVRFDAKEHLDAERARRLDRAAKLATVAVRAALDDRVREGAIEDAARGAAVSGVAAADSAVSGVAAADAAARDALATGAIVGGAFGSIDACAAFVHRFLEKGPRFAAPAAFPSLLPSSPASHAGIYLGLRGVVCSVHDLYETSLAAVVTAAELIAAGDADLIAAGAVEEASPLAERALEPLFPGRAVRRGEGTVAVALRAADARGAAAPMAELVWSDAWRFVDSGAGQGEGGQLGDAPDPDNFGARKGRHLDGAPHPADFGARAVVVCASETRAVRSWLDASPWTDAPVVESAAHTGEHAASGGMALAGAVELLDRGELDAALVVGVSDGRGYALALRRTESS